MASHNPPAAPSQPKERHRGSVIALEGPEEIVATQLHLLPPSSQIMVLPKIQHYISTSTTSHEQRRLRHRSDPRHIISTIHHAAKRRHSVAMEFLQHSTAERKRAVFLEGGTCGAKLMCLDAIGKAYTAGNLEKAAAIFDRLMSQGLKGLEDDGFDVDSIIDPKTSDTWYGNPDVGKGVWANTGTKPSQREDDDEMEDPITRAMRAADALDRETEDLQPPNHDVDLSVPLDFGLIRPRARSLSMSAVENRVGAADGVIRERDDDLDMPSSAARTSSANAFQLLPSPLLIPSNPVTTTITTSFLAISPPSKNTQGQLRKARSYEPPHNLREEARFNLRVDDFDNTQMASTMASKLSATTQHWDAREFTDGAEIGVATTLLGSGTGTEDKDREWDGTASISNYSAATPTTHDATHVGTHATAAAAAVAAVSPKPPRFHVPLRNLFEKKPRTFEGLDADEGSRAVGTEQSRTPSDETKPHSPSEPLLPFNEHYVIHFSNGSKPDEQFTFVASRYKDCLDANPRPSSDLPEIDATTVISQAQELKDMATASEHNMYPASEYDPYRYEEQPEQQSTTPGYVFPASFPITPQAPRFQDISTHNKTAVWVQNTLRSVLDTHSPVEEIDYLSSTSDSPDSQLRSLWEPLMCAEMDDQKDDERKIDLILAIGAEGGVKKDFKQGIMAKIEQLGFPSNGEGMSRSGRLGLRYLIGNAMQTFTSQPLTQQSKENPFSNPTLLASLIIPHIDTYLRGNDNVRLLLIEYPVEHLSTMLAMQKLMGSQIMKVVGISKEADTTMFSMADYRLSAVAVEAEVTECIGTIRDTLASISDFYKPQPAVEEQKEIPAKTLSSKSSNLTSSSIPPLLPPQQSPRRQASPVVMPTFTAIATATPPPPLLPASPVDGYNHTHHYVHSNGQNHGHGGHIHTYLPTTTFGQPNRSISPPPCSHCSSTLSSSITRSNTLISHGTVQVATPSVVSPTSPHSITRERSQRPSISGGSRPTPASPAGSSTLSPRTNIPLSTMSTATTCVQHQQILPPRIVPVITTTNPTSPRTTTTTARLQSPLPLSSGPLSSASTTSLLSTGGTDFHTDVEDPNHPHSDNHSHGHSHLDSDSGSQAEDSADDDNENDDDEEEDDDPFDFFEIDFEERRLMPMFLKEQLEAHVAAAAGLQEGGVGGGGAGLGSGLGAALGRGNPMGHGGRDGAHGVVDLEQLLGGGRKDFGERFFGSGQLPGLPPTQDTSPNGRGNGDIEKALKTSFSANEKALLGDDTNTDKKKKQKHKKGSKKTKTTNNTANTEPSVAPPVLGLGDMAAALEADGHTQHKSSKNLKKKNNKKSGKDSKANNVGNGNGVAANRPLTPNNSNFARPGSSNDANNTYVRPSSRKTTTTMNEQQVCGHSPGANGGEQRKALRWLGLA
ncbi:hypothetical protein B0T20DRAFT_247000 [Sordaria brevicollis]|uniref:Uncharacterized protein n=1 Tax=Sordaria brevicollis TaxID=83679 RepID=A0AAE0UAI1_SORBR|nr:hypothetical protein B0T20DRAFT_247000 [Sordaria brevicollis]